MMAASNHQAIVRADDREPRAKGWVMTTGQSLTLGTLLRRARRAAGLTQEEMAERAGISLRTISDIERELNHTPRRDTMILLADALGLGGAERTDLVAAAGRMRYQASLTSPGQGMVSRETMRSFVGRQRELALLERHLSGEGPPLLLLAGEPGIGKTRLLQAAIPRAMAQGRQVLEGGCSRQGGQEPYAPVLDALQRYLRGRSTVDARAQLRGCAWLVRLLPELAEGPIEPLPNWIVPAEHERRLMIAAAARFLSNIAGPAGTVLVLDDLQWAGQDALDLLRAFARMAGEIPLRIIGAYRDTEVHPGHPLSTLIADLSSAGVTTELPLGPLADENVAHLLDDLLAGYDVTAAVRTQVLERSGGVPFFVISYAGSVQAGILTDGAIVRTPRGLGQSIRRRVAALPEIARELLGVAAIMGRIVPRTVLRAVMVARATSDVLHALDVACQARLLEELDARDYRFTHDVIREVIEEDLGAARQADLHGKVAEALEQESGDLAVEALAFHYDRSDMWKRAAHYLERAGDHAATQYANTTAEQLYRNALEHLDPHQCDLDGARVREKSAAVLSACARYDAALTMLTTAMAVLRREGNREGVARVSAQIGLLHAEKGTPDVGTIYVQPLLNQVDEALSPGTRATLYRAAARLNYYSGRYEEQLAAATQAAELAQAAGDSRSVVMAGIDRGLALYSLARVDDALQTWEEVILLTEAGGYLDELCTTLTLASCIFEDDGEFAKQHHYIDRALRVAERCGNTAQLGLLYTRRGMSAFFVGDWRQALQDYEEAVTLNRRIEASWRSPWPLLDLGRLCLYEGRWEDACQYLQESLRMSRSDTDLNLLREVHCVLAEHDLLSGHPEAARARLTPLLERPGMMERQVTRLLPILAWAQLEMGDLKDAAATVTQGISRARRERTPILLVDALRIHAVISISERRWDDAESALREGLTLARVMAYRYAEARLLHVYGHLHMALGAFGPARERLEEALTVFRRLGAGKDVERAELDISALPALDALE
jgi:tetratricopeptide (TPR) repeat protein/transcriptional regulator with XRE-family HTH domain